MAYRAGADLVNMEIPMRWAGPKYFARCGKATWVGVLRDPHDKPVGPFVTKPDRVYGDPISDSYKGLFEDYMKTGKGPVFMDCRGISNEDYDYMMHYMKHEALHGILHHLDEVNKYSIDNSLVLAIIKTESNFNVDAVSPKGAVGLMQLMPTTAKWISDLNGIKYSEEDLFVAEKNIAIGITYLEYLTNQFENDLENILAVFNYNLFFYKFQNNIINHSINFYFY